MEQDGGEVKEALSRKRETIEEESPVAPIESPMVVPSEVALAPVEEPPFKV